MPGVLPVVNKKAVEYAVRVALALECEIATTSVFARKSYFYPDLPKGYQISQYEQPLARNGKLNIQTSEGEQVIRIRRVHLEEDTGKLTHVRENGSSYSLVDLNRSGIPLLEIVSEPEMRSVAAVREYAVGLRSVLRYLGVNSGDLEKGLFRIEPNISLRPVGSEQFGTRTELKNLNSFRALERGVAYEIDRQRKLLEAGKAVVQETRGWLDDQQITVPQRSKEDAEDYRYFPEPDLPPLVIEQSWIEEIRAGLPELPHAKIKRFMQEYGLSAYDAGVLAREQAVADYFEQAVAAASKSSAKQIANWVSRQIFSYLNETGAAISGLNLTPNSLAGLMDLLASGEINAATAKEILAEMLASGGEAGAIVEARGLRQISDRDAVQAFVEKTLSDHPAQVAEYRAGKEEVLNWLFGRVMGAAKGKANPEVVREELSRQLAAMKENSPK
jgi:aspartyl-tRNA(Asn)/glutamyl-tRNA(Gln) amidotransferase subunit B